MSKIMSAFGNRPDSLESLENYKYLLEKPIGFSWDTLPDLLKANIMCLEGIKPLTSCVNHLVPYGFMTNPNLGEIEYYKNTNTEFQIIHIVANVFNIHDCGSHLLARPYAISLMPAVKRGKPETVNINFLKEFDLNRPLIPNMVYVNFNPFSGEAFMGAPYTSVVGATGQTWYSDTIGFLVGT